MERARRAKAKYVNSLMAKPNVVAVGIGYKVTGGKMTDELCIVVSVIRKVEDLTLVPSPDEVIPSSLDGVPTDIQETGVIRALQDRTDKWRPAPGGVSIGHKDITAGTLGCLVQRGGETFILSNNHVLADCNRGQIGDPILQPGPHDGSTLEDQIAELYDFVPIRFGELSPPDCPFAKGAVGAANWLARAAGSRHRLRVYQEEPNLVDAALAAPLSYDLVSHQILEVGFPEGTGEAELGMAVQKSGRTTGWTKGTVVQMDMTVQVFYGEAGVAVYEDQVASDCGSGPGDSGSAVLDMDRRVMGLLFAGGGGLTILNRMANVKVLLGVDI